MDTAELSRHLTEGDVLRYVDEEGSPDSRARWSAHIEACDACSDAVTQLRFESRHLSAWLDRAYPGSHQGATGPRLVAASTPRGSRAVRDRRVRPAAASWLKAAAAVVLIAGPLVAVPPVRSWIAERVAGDSRAGDVPTLEDEAAPATEPTAIVESSRIRFVPSPGRFVVSIQGEWRGSLELRRADGEEAVFESLGVAPETVVAASRLEVRASDEGGRYSLALPAAVSDVVVLADGRSVRVSGPELDRGRELPGAPSP